MDGLLNLGVEAHCPSLPSCNVTPANVADQDDPAFSEPPPPGGWPSAAGDAEHLKNVVRELVDGQGKHLIIAAHSYGGWVASEAAVPELLYPWRQQRGKSGGIFAMFLSSAYLVPLGLSVNDLVPEHPLPPFVKLFKYGTAGLNIPDRINEYFFQNIKPTEREYWVSKLRGAPTPLSKLTNEPWYSVPNCYVVGTDDPVIPPEAQRKLIEGKTTPRAHTEDHGQANMVHTDAEGRAGSSGAKFIVYEEPFDHEAFLSSAQRLAEILVEFGTHVNPNRKALLDMQVGDG
ncbi:MAG: hypothetical protein M1831_005976 [Alyxoria varia]|nr:MAG: hypothetical protein M1831_005976 [Alyxoria varia]